MFCDIRIHEQVKKMNAIKNEIDSFQSFCTSVVEKHNAGIVREGELQNDDMTSGSMRGDEFLKSSIQLQSQLIGKILIEVYFLLSMID